MGLGINLGNTLDAVGDWIDQATFSITEQAWKPYYHTRNH